VFRKIIFIIALFIPVIAFGQAPSNDDCAQPKILSNPNFCYEQLTNVGATASGLGPATTWPQSSAGKDVWYTFRPQYYDVNITVSGNVTGSGPGTLQSPLVALYTTTDCLNFNELIGPTSTSNNVTTLYRGGLAKNLGQVYYIRVSAANNNVGTFELCISNYTPPLKAGQDYSTASPLCSKGSFTQTNVVGAGGNNREAAGTCLDNVPPGFPIEFNDVLYNCGLLTCITGAAGLTPTEKL